MKKHDTLYWCWDTGTKATHNGLLTDITDLSLPLIHTCTFAVNRVTRPSILTPTLWLTVLAIVPSRAGVVTVDSYPSWLTLACTIFFVTSCIVKTLAFSITLRSKETLTAFRFTVVTLEARLTSKKRTGLTCKESGLGLMEIAWWVNGFLDFWMPDEVKTLTKARMHGSLTLTLRPLNSTLSSPDLSGGQGHQFCCVAGKIPCLTLPLFAQK